jgi:hypothetical protein
VFGAVLDAESGLIMFRSCGGPKFLEMSLPICNGDQSPARTENSRHFRKSLVQRRNVIKHPGGDHGIE